MNQEPDTGFGGPDQPAASSLLPQYVPHGDVARRLGLSVKTVRKWAREGLNGCPALYDLGDKRAVMRLDEVQAWIAARRVSRSAATAGGSDARRDDAAPECDVA